jgi:hypothetical protein
VTLAEAIDWISKQGNYSRSAATRQIREALAADAIGPLRWEDAWMDHRPADRQFWLVEARIRRGRVFDPSVKRWRTLQIGKHSILQARPESPDLAFVASAASESGQAIDAPITKAKGGRPSAKEEIYQALDKLLHEKGRSVKDTMPREKLAELLAKECGKLLGKSPGWSLGAVLNHIRSWAKKH